MGLRHYDGYYTLAKRELQEEIRKDREKERQREKDFERFKRETEEYAD